MKNRKCHNCESYVWNRVVFPNPWAAERLGGPVESGRAPAFQFQLLPAGPLPCDQPCIPPGAIIALLLLPPAPPAPWRAGCSRAPCTVSWHVAPAHITQSQLSETVDKVCRDWREIAYTGRGKDPVIQKTSADIQRDPEPYKVSLHDTGAEYCW